MKNSRDISASNGKELTVNTPGRYLISYNVNTSLPSTAGTRLMINGKADEASAPLSQGRAGSPERIAAFPPGC